MTFELEKILTSLKGENEVADLLLLYWNDISGKRISEEDFFGILTAPALMPPTIVSPKSPPVSSEQWINKDLRICSMWLEGYRGIPKADGKGIEYGISMYPKLKDIKDKVPFSMVLLGSNGSGKTSLYSAIELLCLGSTSIEKKHKVKGEAFEKFYHHLSREDKTMKISVLFNNDAVISFKDKNDLNKISAHIDLSSFFCSESDIAMFECSGESVVAYLDHQIGLGELLDVSRFIENLSANIEQKEDATEQNHHYENLYSKLQDVKDKITDEVDGIRSVILPAAQNILNRLLEDYTDDVVGLSNANISSDSGNENVQGPFNGKLLIKEDKIEIEPRDYFNNFRFKLYLISIRIAIAFHVMRTRHISFPLMFDDVFDSSDFSNRVKTKKFINKIFTLYKELEISNRSLQIIFFTQDEVIAESVYDGIMSSAENRCQKENTMFVRLFSAFPESEIRKGEDTRIENEEKFYNLYDTIRINFN
ncbi:MAG: ATP-binding protein [Ruminococcus sp.]|nr:ATP-binding protein [Ruminococcus sp.]